jgi:hypothetical protein
MTSRPRVVALVIASVCILVIGALVARGGPAPSTAARADATKPNRAGPTALTGSSADAHPAALTPRDVAALVSEAALMVRLHELGETVPPLSLQLARKGNARFPRGPDAPERAFIVVKSLVDLGRFKEAQQEARLMLRKYPHDPHTLDVERHLLSNPLE